MQSKYCHDVALYFWFVVLVNFVCLSYGQTTKWPETLEEKVDALAAASADGNDPKNYLLPLGAEAVSIITQKLQRSLAEGSSAEGARAFAMLDMPQVDQKRANRQIGLVAMLGVALREMPLNPTIKEAALNALYSALKSPYMISRKSALYAVANVGGISAVDEIVPLLDDVDKSNRVIAAKMLAKIGDASTAEKIEKVLERRRQGLTKEQEEKDWSFRHGYEAIKSLRNKATVAPIKADRTPTHSVPVIAVQQMSSDEVSHAENSAVVDSKSSSGFPIVPVAIIAVIVVGGIVLLLRRT